MRPLRVEDAARVYDDARDPDIYRFQQQRPPRSVDELRERFRRWSDGSSDAHVVWLNWCALERESGRIAGLLQATIDCAARTATLGYTIFPAFQHRGYAREAAGAMLEAVFARGDVERAVAEISEPNYRSRAVVESLGFVPCGRIPGAGRDDGRVCDDVVYERRQQRASGRSTTARR
ncbi:MAG: GNAT family N-acetyltransferase [Candidatus Velthaea sp.]